MIFIDPDLIFLLSIYLEEFCPMKKQFKITSTGATEDFVFCFCLFVCLFTFVFTVLEGESGALEVLSNHFSTEINPRLGFSRHRCAPSRV